ncbi:hypothetical protein EBR04_05485 [bacterium]|nr:hypothetical protein [bacterium]
MEQPMMRNEHIVRAHQTPIVAVNPANGTEWSVIHVDSAAAANGDGSVTAPVRTLAAAQALATDPYDVVFVHAGTSATTPYAAAWQFQADDQILVGEGSTLALNTVSCGYTQFFTSGAGTATYPLLTSTGDAITLRNGAVVDHLRIVDAPAAIVADATLTAGANVNDVQIATGVGQTAVQLTNLPGSQQVNLLNMNVTNRGRGLWINGGAADVTFQGKIATTASGDESILVQNLGGGEVQVNSTSTALDTPVARNTTLVASAPFSITDVNSAAPAAIQVASNVSTTVTISQATIATPTRQGVLVQNNTATQVSFLNLTITDAAEEAFSTVSNDGSSSVTIDGRSAISSLSTTLPAFASNDDATLAITLESLRSAVPLAAPPYAVDLQGGSSGSFEITDEFLVSGSPGTAANVDNGTTGVPPTTGPVTVTLP